MGEVANFTNSTVATWNGFVEPEESKTFRILLYIVVGVCAFVGNIVVVRAVYREPGRKPFSYSLVTNLAVAELLSTLFFPFLFEFDNSWTLGLFMCKFSGLQNTFGIAVTWTLAGIAVYRWQAISFPLSLGKLSKARKMLLLIFIWAVALATNLPSLVTLTLLHHTDGNIYCVENWTSPKAKHAYTFVFEAVAYVIPLFFMITSYVLVGLKIWKHISSTKKRSEELRRSSTFSTSRFTNLELGHCEQRNEVAIEKLNVLIVKANETKEVPIEQWKNVGMYNTPRTSSTGLESTIALTQQPINENAPQTGNKETGKVHTPQDEYLLEMEQDLLKMIYIIVLISVLCYLPYQVLFVLAEIDNGLLEITVWHTLGNYFVWVTFLPSALHPICYGTKSRFYAKTFRRLISCFRCLQRQQRDR